MNGSKAGERKTCAGGTGLDEPIGRRTTDGTSEGARRPGRLSEELEHLVEAFKHRSVRLREVLEVTQKRGYTMLVIVLTFPFCTPMPMPGLSAPFGLVVAIIGFRLALGQNPWLPARLLDRELPQTFFPRVLAGTCRLARAFEYFLKPRLVHIMRWRLTQHALGLMICICGFLMILPLPIPFSNGLPAMAVLFLAAAMLEEDGYFAVAGGFVFLLSLAFFGAIFWGGTELVDFLTETFQDVFRPDDAPADR